MLDCDLAVICTGPFRVFGCLESNTKREGYINFNLRGTFSGKKTRTTVGEGMQNNNTWFCSETTLETTDAIVIKDYAQVEGQIEKLFAVFITEQLNALKLDSSIWIVYYWTKLQQDKTRADFRFGD